MRRCLCALGWHRDFIELVGIPGSRTIVWVCKDCKRIDAH